MPFAIRCTAKLLKRLGVPPKVAAVSAPEATTLLGDWYATLVFDRSGQYIVACSARTFLPVIIPARDLKTNFARALSEAILQTLERIEASDWFIAHEQVEMVEYAISKTQSKQVLGVMNDYLYQLGGGIGRESIASLALHIGMSPLSPLRMNNPIDTTLLLSTRTGPVH